jgi:pimeloyl-ACP methyl ester carboxylesterase
MASQAAPRRKNRWRNRLLFFVVALVVALTGLSAVMGIEAGRAQVYPLRIPSCCDTPATYSVDYEDVTLLTEDGLALKGWYIPAQNRAAVMVLHGHGGNRVGVLGEGLALARHGYGVLMVDLRAHGDSDGDLYAFGWRDGVAAAGFLTSQPEVDPNRIGAIGFSLGAVIAIHSAAHTPQIAAVVADGIGVTHMDDFPGRTTLLDWWAIPYDIADLWTVQSLTQETLPSMKAAALQVSPRPIFLITYDPGGSADVEPLLTRDVYQAIPGEKALWEVPGVGHVGGFGAYPDEYEQRIVAFFDDSLLGSGE